MLSFSCPPSFSYSAQPIMNINNANPPAYGGPVRMSTGRVLRGARRCFRGRTGQRHQNETVFSRSSARLLAAVVALGLLPSAAFAEEDIWRRPKPTLPQQRWNYWPVLPVAPYDRRVTIRKELVPGELWAFDQKLGIYYVQVPIRMTVYRMRSRKGLFVYAPVAPTEECVALLRELEDLHGPVLYVVLPTCAVEHKWFVGPFTRYFPTAQVWVAPGQFSVPLPLPLQFLGFPGDRLRVLPKDSLDASIPQDWRAEGIDYRVLGPIGKQLNTGAFAEAVFYLRPLKAMLVCDLVLHIPREIPQIVLEDPRALAFHARDGPLSEVDVSPEAMQRGWKRICIFALLFGTTAIEVQSTPDAIRDALRSPALELGWSGLLPCNYAQRWESTFEAIQGGSPNGLLVPPILSELVLNRYLSSDVWPFVEEIATAWSDAEMILPAHFDTPVAAGVSEWRDAFRRAFGEPRGPGVLQTSGGGPPQRGPQPQEADLEFIRNISDSLTNLGVINPPERMTYLSGAKADNLSKD